ncbi:hypothetical protein [Bacillus atrophaeus]|uniref:hypothetical protein n=1 Tax=Bacillus atrophaeus TaxID=1452 RepID=UPI002E219CE1|nr:hypothetical protein [Bacillus atrophaeus]
MKLGNLMFKKNVASILAELEPIMLKMKAYNPTNKKEIESFVQDYYWSSNKFSEILKKLLKLEAPPTLEETYEELCDSIIGIITAIEVNARSLDVKNGVIIQNLRDIGEELMESEFSALKQNLNIILSN